MVHTILQSHHLQTYTHGFNIQAFQLNKQTEQGNLFGTDLISQKTRQIKSASNGEVSRKPGERKWERQMFFSNTGLSPGL